MSDEGKMVKVTVNLPSEVVEDLKGLATRYRRTVTEQLRRAISTEVWFDEVRGQFRVLLEDRSTGKLREVVFKD